MSTNEFEILKILFQEHHRQYAEKWHNVHVTTQASSASLLAVTGWILLGKEIPNSHLVPYIIGFIITISLIACGSVFSNIHNARRVAEVIEKINIGLGLYEVGKFLPEQTLYPEKWRGFGSRSKLGMIFNCLLILISAGVCIAAVLTRSS